jgi:hypothetical protein
MHRENILHTCAQQWHCFAWHMLYWSICLLTLLSVACMLRCSLSFRLVHMPYRLVQFAHRYWSFHFHKTCSHQLSDRLRTWLLERRSLSRLSAETSSLASSARTSDSALHHTRKSGSLFQIGPSGIPVRAVDSLGSNLSWQV